MEITIPIATEIAIENEAGTQYSAVINGQRWSGIRTEHKVIPAREVEVTKKVVDPETLQVVEVTETVQVPEQKIWVCQYGASVQKAIDEGAAVEPYVAPPPPDPTIIALAATDKYMARITEDLIDTLKAKGVITDEDLPASAVAKINERKALRAD